MLVQILFTLGLASVTRGFTTFETKCSTPDTAVNFVSAADTRGTLEILWSCLFTIIACAWTVQHLNVPEQHEGRDLGWRGDVRWRLKDAWSSAKWMLATAIAPELLLGKAYGDLQDAKSNLRDLKKYAEIDEVPWSLTHSLFANMGGFVIRWNAGRIAANSSLVDGAYQTISEDSNTRHTVGTVQNQSGPDGQEPLDSMTQKSDNVTQVTQQTLPGLEVDLENTQAIERPSGTQSQVFHNPIYLTAPMILAIRKANVLTSLPCITMEEINDKSKRDAFAQAVALLQIVWTIVQIIARAARNLAVSQLEIAVVALAACTIIIYALNWSKPKGVQVPITMLQYQQEVPFQISSLLAAHSHSDIRRALWVQAFHISESEADLGSALRNDSNSSFDSDVQNLGATLLASVLFGGINLAAWRFVFPTAVEQTLWRIASLWSACAAFVCPGILVVVAISEFFVEKERFRAYSFWLFRLIFFLYVLARLYLVAEAFRSLCFLPPDAYVATWATNIPHLA